MSLQAGLDETVKAASNRAAEGQKLFSPIATFLDKHLRMSTNLSPHLLGALSALSLELSSVAQRHFDAYITSTAASGALMAQQPINPPSPPPTRPPSGLSQLTYATVASSNAPSKSTLSTKTPATKAPLTRAPKKGPLKEPTPNNRLFVRLPASHLARDIQGYAILTSLRSQLGSNSSALKEVQPTKTGFALCPSSLDALTALEAQKITISDFFRGCQVEKGSCWVSYRVTNAPRTIGQLNTDNNNYSLVPITSYTIS
jgi:hypothetical protein